MLDPDELDIEDDMDCVADDDDRGLVMKALTNKNNQYNKKFLSNVHNNTNGPSSLNGWCNNDRKPRKRQRYHQPQQTASRFDEVYQLTGETLGRGAYARVEACVNRINHEEYAVKIIEKHANHSRIRVIKEVELFHLCAGHSNIVQLIEYFEEDDKFYLVFEIMRGGPLLSHIQRKICFTENEASLVIRDLANALKFLHDRGIAHRDLKPENILCTYPDTVSPVKLCDLDLASKCSAAALHSITTPELQSPVGSAEFMAPEVVDAFVGESLRYDKRCDLWSLGVILYIMLCGYPPFYGECDQGGDCGWNQGLPCPDCQETLFAKIQLGNFDFPPQEWTGISQDAKDLIRHLLEKDVNRRYGVDDVLQHPFIVNEAPKTPLQTPNILLRNDSKRDLAENFAAFERFKLHTRLSTGAGVGHTNVEGGIASPAIAVVNSLRSPMFHFGTTGTTGCSSPTLMEVPSTTPFILRKPQLPPTGNKGSNSHLQRPPSGCQAIGSFVVGNLINTGQRPSSDGVSVKV
jgi:MAP kinase interacting serine/threonine kinase